MKSFVFTFVTVLFFSFSVQAEKSSKFCANLPKALGEGTPKQKFNRLLAEQWKHQMEESPESATFSGYPGQNDRLSDLSLEALARHRQDTQCELTVLKTIPSNMIKGEDLVSFELFKRKLEIEIEGQKFDSDYLVLDHMNGLHLDLPDLLAAMPSSHTRDYEDMIKRFEKVSLYEEQLEVLMREGLKRKVTPVQIFLTKVPAQFDQVLTEQVTDSPLYAPFKKMNPEIAPSDQEKLKKKALEVLSAQVYPALKKLRTFIVTTYIPGARQEISCASLPNGKAWYQYLVKYHTTTNQTPSELHQLGLGEVERIKQEMEKIREEVEFKGDRKAFNQELLTNPKFYYTDAKDLLAGYRSIAKSIDMELPSLFKHLPRLPYGVHEMPAYKAASAPAAYYMQGSLEAGKAGHFEANTYQLNARPKWGMEALTLHESVPGHHLQIALAQELEGLPDFRKNEGGTAFVEGWGLYAEGLGDALGLYQDPYSRYGKYSYELWRAVRLVVDTGMHEMGWSRQKALDYYQDLLPKSKIESEVEIDRYITWPGQALAYKVGQLKFLELREKAKNLLGNRYDVR